MAQDRDVVRGPWPAVLVEQPGADGKWWHRDEHGILWVRCAGRDGWHDSPVPMAEGELPEGVPERTRITTALDRCGLDGPEVDEALGVANALDTAVDEWERGDLVPSGDELRRLAFLTGVQPRWFFGPAMPTLEGVFICRR